MCLTRDMPGRHRETEGFRTGRGIHATGVAEVVQLHQQLLRPAVVEVAEQEAAGAQAAVGDRVAVAEGHRLQRARRNRPAAFEGGEPACC